MPPAKEEAAKRESPTFKTTTDNPPYGQYPKTELQQPIHLLASTFETQRKGGRFIRLSKKYYTGDEQLPWASTKIDLSFPEIKQVYFDGLK